MAERTICWRCRRPSQVCVCAELVPIDSRTRVLFIQHPRESRMPVSTCRLAHLSLPNSDMAVTMGPERHQRIAAQMTAPGTMVLFPGPGSVDVQDLPAPPSTLVVVDGTWINARKLVERSPMLSALPRVQFTPRQPSNYRIRREPTATCVSTIEAVVHMLEEIESAPGRFTPMLGAFSRMIDNQLAYIAQRGPQTRRLRKGPAKATPAEHLATLGDRLVLVFAEGHPLDGPDGPPRLHHWMAERFATGERFEAVVRPRWPRGMTFGPDGAPVHPRAEEPTEAFEAAAARWAAFSRPGDVHASWGRFAPEILAAEGLGEAQVLDMKRLVTNVLSRTVGGVEALAEARGGVLPGAVGETHRRLAALVAVTQAVVRNTLRA